jgi:signal peptidase I
MKKAPQSLIKILVDILYYLCITGIVFICLRVFIFASFKIPSDSMSPSLTTGDNVLVFKPTMGETVRKLIAKAFLFGYLSEHERKYATLQSLILVFGQAGGRLFNLFATLRGERVTVYRVPGIRKLRRNDVVVFNFPHPRDWDKIEMHIMKYYIKRCIGLPGDMLSIRNGFFEIRGV